MVYEIYVRAKTPANPAFQDGRTASPDAHLANRSVLDNFELLYWRNDKRQECDYVLKKGQSLIAIEVKSSRADDLSGFEKFKNLYADRIAEAFIVGPEGLPLEDFFNLDIKPLFRKIR